MIIDNKDNIIIMIKIDNSAIHKTRIQNIRIKGVITIKVITIEGMDLMDDIMDRGKTPIMEKIKVNIKADIKNSNKRKKIIW